MFADVTLVNCWVPYRSLIVLLPLSALRFTTTPGVDAICRTALGDAVLSRRFAGFVLDAFTTLDQFSDRRAVRDPELDQLTSREREVLRHIARGYTYKEIATTLEISTKSVESHVSSVLRKLQLTNRYQLSNWATERRLL